MSVSPLSARKLYSINVIYILMLVIALCFQPINTLQLCARMIQNMLKILHVEKNLNEICDLMFSLRYFGVSVFLEWD